MKARIAVLTTTFCCIILLATLQQLPFNQVNAQSSGFTSLISVSLDGGTGDNYSILPAISGDGRYVAFYSHVSNLVPDDGNGSLADIFVRDRQTNKTTLVSVASDGTQANLGVRQWAPDISDNGRFVTFVSSSTNLVPDDTNGHEDIFVHDRQTGETTRVSVASDGTQANNVSYFSTISHDGRLVTFESAASNLVPNDTNGDWDIFVHDRQTGETTRVSVASDGTQANDSSFSPVIADDGRFVGFESEATNLTANDTNGKKDLFIHDLQTGETTRVNIATDGTEANEDAFLINVSNSGRFTSFYSSATNLIPDDTNDAMDTFVHDRQTGETIRVSIASDGTEGIVPPPTPGLVSHASESHSKILTEERFIVFSSDANNLVSNDKNYATDVFVHDLETRQTKLASIAWDGGPIYTNSFAGTVSDDGQFVTFVTRSGSVVPNNDVNGTNDVFIHNLRESSTGTATISGKVSDTTGNPLSNIMIIAYRFDSTWNPVARSFTTISGHYTIKALEAGTYRVQFISLSGDHYPQYFNNKSAFNEADDLDVAMTSITPNINASLVTIPPPPLRVDEGCGRVDFNGMGQVFLSFPLACSGSADIIATINCNDESTPTDVTFWLNDQSFPMTAVDDTSYNVTLTIPDHLPDGDIAVKVTAQCGAEVEIPIEGEVGLYDPSGIITDAQTGQVIPGAIVNLFTVPEAQPDVDSVSSGDCRTVDSRPINSDGQFGAWSGLTSAEQTIAQWVHPVSLVGSTVAISPTINPQVTGPDGRYGWDVSAGCWYIEVRADGYQTLVSPLVGVPPEVTDLNLSLHKNVGYLPTIIKAQ